MLHLLLIGLAIAVTYFAVTWAISVKVNNYGFLDVAFSYGVAILAPLYTLNSPGHSALKWALTFVGVAWSLRLGTYILLRVLRHHPQEDVRYETLRKSWPGSGMFLLFFELQALLVVVFSLPFLLVSFADETAPTWFQIVGIVVAVCSLVGETVADLQMQRFKADPKNRGRVCEVGLWRYSRHPNYFFESLIWWGIFLVALGVPWGWITLACPLLMLFFLFKVTGIPLTEEYAVRSKGDAYREYQRTTSPFIPWFRKP